MYFDNGFLEDEMMLEKPRLIQRGYFDRKDGILEYEYMGYAEFEWGDQAKSLKRIFEREVKIEICPVIISSKISNVYLVIREDFKFSDYYKIVQGLINIDWHTKERVWLDVGLRKKLKMACDFEIKTEAWFDFFNDVFIVLSQEDANLLLTVFSNIKESWRQRDEWLDSPKVKEFQKELEKIKIELLKSGSWSSLGNMREVNGELEVRLKSMEHSGWYKLQDLRDRLKNELKK